MTKDSHGDARRPDGDLRSGVAPFDARTECDPDEFGPKVGWGHDAVYRPAEPAVGDDGGEPETEQPGIEEPAPGPEEEDATVVS